MYSFIDRNFQASVKIILDCFVFASLWDWSRKLSPLSWPIVYKTNTVHDSVARVRSPALKAVWLS